MMGLSSSLMFCTTAPVMRRIASYHAVTKPLINYYLQLAESGDPRAPHYVNLYGRGSIEHIRDKMFAALAQTGLAAVPTFVCHT